MTREKCDFKTFLTLESCFDAVIIDPPWRYQDNESPSNINNQVTYSRWEDNRVELENIFSKINTKYLFIWVTNSLLHDIFSCNSYNYSFKSIITWVKLTKNSNLSYGLGKYFRNCTEQLLLFVKKGEKPLRLKSRNLIQESSLGRTQKPRNFEKQLLLDLQSKGFSKFLYLFSGPNVDCFADIGIICNDIIFDLSSIEHQLSSKYKFSKDRTTEDLESLLRDKTEVSVINAFRVGYRPTQIQKYTDLDVNKILKPYLSSL